MRHAFSRASSFAFHPHHADEKAREHSLETQRKQGRARNDHAHGDGIIEIAKPGQPPFVHSREHEIDSDKQSEPGARKAALQIDDFIEMREVPVGWKNSDTDRERAREYREQHGLEAA